MTTRHRGPGRAPQRKGLLRDLKPTMEPTGRIAKLKVLVGGIKNPRVEIREYHVGARPDRLDFNPIFCFAFRKKGGGQCGKRKLKGLPVCAVHGGGYKSREAAGEKLSPKKRGALGEVVSKVRAAQRAQAAQQAAAPPDTPPDGAEPARDENDPMDDPMYRLFRAITLKAGAFIDERVAFYRKDPDVADLEHDAILLSAVRDAVLAGHFFVKGDTLLSAVTALTNSKAGALRVKAAIDQRDTVPMEKVQDLLGRITDILHRFVPIERHPEVLRELRLLEMAASDTGGDGRAVGDDTTGALEGA